MKHNFQLRYWFDNFWYSYGFVVSMAGIIALIVALIWWTHAATEKANPGLYQSWTHVTGQTNVAYADWLNLKNHHLLPGQSAEDTVVPVFIPISTGR